MNKLLTREFFDKQKAKLANDSAFQAEKARYLAAIPKFQTRFNGTSLSSKTDDELINMLFQNETGNNDNLYHNLAFNKDLPVSITNIPPCNIGAVYLKGQGWLNSKYESINRQELIAIAHAIRAFVVNVERIVSKNKSDLYDKIDSELNVLFTVFKTNQKVLYGKYLGCLFPSLFPPFYSESWQKRILENEYDSKHLCSNFRKIKELMDSNNLDSITFGKCIWSAEELKVEEEKHDKEKEKILNSLHPGSYSLSDLFDRKIFVRKNQEKLEATLKTVAKDFPDSFKYDKKAKVFTVLDEEKNKDIKDVPTDVLDLVSSSVVSNKLFYGIPGCGKSYKVDKIAKQIVSDEELDIVRTTFYLDYSYNDFVGQLAPHTIGKDIIYKINPGPFTDALSKAYSDKDRKIVLIIEEINRGNAPAIFGDIFQLLDRKDGVSEYGINNQIISSYLKQIGVANPFSGKIKIPSNLYIFATMNSSDQNVFKLDTAFKRRWIMERMTNEDSRNAAEANNNFMILHLNISWVDFVDAVNSKLIRRHVEEDRQLGYWFMTQKDLIAGEEANCFANKVLEYLWNDVLKFHDKDVLFTSNIDSLDELINQYKKGNNVFAGDIVDAKSSDGSIKE